MASGLTFRLHELLEIHLHHNMLCYIIRKAAEPYSLYSFVRPPAKLFEQEVPSRALNQCKREGAERRLD